MINGTDNHDDLEDELELEEQETRQQRQRRLRRSEPKTVDAITENVLASGQTYRTRLNALRVKLDDGQQLTDEELEYLINRPAIALLESEDPKDVHKALELFQQQRIKRLALKEAEALRDVRRTKESDSGLDLPR